MVSDDVNLHPYTKRNVTLWTDMERCVDTHLRGKAVQVDIMLTLG